MFVCMVCVCVCVWSACVSVCDLLVKFENVCGMCAFVWCVYVVWFVDVWLAWVWFCMLCVVCVALHVCGCAHVCGCVYDMYMCACVVLWGGLCECMVC